MIEQFYGVFRACNIAVWPAQWLLVLLGLAAIVLALAPGRGSGVAVSALFTVGLLCFAVPPTPRSPLIVSLLWCLFGIQAAFLFGVRPDLGHIAVAAVGIGLLLTACGRHRMTTA